MKEISDFAIPVHRSILRRDLFLGVPLMPLVILVVLTIIMVLDFMQLIFIPITICIWYGLKKITDADEWFLEILFGCINQPDIME